MPNKQLSPLFSRDSCRFAYTEAEESLIKSEERFRSLVETSSDLIWEIDTECRHTYASPKVKDLLGYDPEEMLNKIPFDFMVPDEHNSLKLNVPN